ncbi:GPW/gp25 family protein [Burkholderia sp. TSV86]|uniref:GPW/gp25 family protein n=1 Tax=Burkholderia sp. TSV86 TaxID=1385594 RepID=UPI0009E8FA06|nr:GPW/gp25 family protein [Burkholderia sp. TSV86]
MVDQLYNKLSKRFKRDSLKDVVGHHLVDLMNCSMRGARISVLDNSPAAHSVLNYGCPPMQVPGSTRIDPVQTASHICEVMRRFEPRVDMTRTSVRPRPGRDRHARQVMYFDILTISKESKSEIKLSLALDYLDGFFSLADA